ncbi:MAG: DNA-packaging protein, partial [Candidatus Lokiarchaeota archaeon]|nr:DNA-packaging protein [Candidatus Lokiarchaeota archaeon]
NGWAKIAVNAYKKYKADRIIGEVNQGGDMVGNTIRTIDKNVSYGSVRATRGKEIRAEPVMALYEQGKVYHLHGLDKLENQLTTWDPETNNKSPDRLDALVWLVTELMLDTKGSPQLLWIDEPAVDDFDDDERDKDGQPYPAQHQQQVLDLREPELVHPHMLPRQQPE